MKLSSSLLPAALALFSATSTTLVDVGAAAVSASTLRGGAFSIDTAQSTRHLGPDEDDTAYFFLVSHIRQDEAWCITAVEGSEDFGNLKLRLCDFDGAPPSQLFYAYEDDNDSNEPGSIMIGSAFDNKCITINYGENLFDGVRARLTDCDATTNLNDFFFQGNGDSIQVAVEGGGYCLTNVGPNPHANDFIHAKPCQERNDFKWTTVIAAPSGYFELRSGGGCAVPSRLPDTTKNFLESCDDFPNHRWRAEPVCLSNGAVLLVSEVDETKCLRAGLGDDVESGSMMRLQPCDIEDELQHFVYDGSRFQLYGRPDLCMVYRGTNAHIGVDPIIMKTCNDYQEGWIAPYPLSSPSDCTEAPSNSPSNSPSSAPSNQPSMMPSIFPKPSLQCTCSSWTDNACGSDTRPYCNVGRGQGYCVCFSPAAGSGGSVCAEVTSDWTDMWNNNQCNHDDECASGQRCGFNPCGARTHCMNLCDDDDETARREMEVDDGLAATPDDNNCEGVPCE